MRAAAAGSVLCRFMVHVPVFVVAPEIVVKEAGQAVPESTRPLAQLVLGSIRLGPTCI